MRSTRLIVVLTLVLCATLVSLGSGQQPKAADQKPADHGLFTPDAVQWQAGPPSLAAGAKSAVLEGDPTKEGIFTMRLRLPDGFQIKPHWHPAVERVTVLVGTFNLGKGETFDQAKTEALTSGSFVFMPPKMNHYAWAKGDTILQLTGQGPWQINYLNPADDPRSKKE